MSALGSQTERVFRYATRRDLSLVEFDVDAVVEAVFLVGGDSDLLVSIDDSGYGLIDRQNLPLARKMARLYLDRWVEQRGRILDLSGGPASEPFNGFYGEARFAHGSWFTCRSLLVGPDRGGPVYVLAYTQKWPDRSSDTYEGSLYEEIYALLHGLDVAGLWDNDEIRSRLTQRVNSLAQEMFRNEAGLTPEMVEDFVASFHGDERIADAVVTAGAMIDRATREGRFPRPMRSVASRSRGSRG